MITICREGPESFAEHGRVPIYFVAESRLDLDRLASGEIKAIPMSLRLKDHDLFPEERPESLVRRTDVGQWVLLAAYEEGRRVGGAIVACSTPDFPFLEGDHQAVVVDLRVHPERRGNGIGRLLVQASGTWATEQGCEELRIETQDVNVEACRFYQACGLTVYSIERDAYGPDIDEARILWSLKL